PVKPVAPEEAVRVAPPPAPSRLPLWIGARVALTAAAGGGTFAGLAIREHTTLVRRTTLPGEREDAQRNGRLLAHLADAAMITAVAAAGFTAYWYFYRYRGRLTISTADVADDPGDSRPAR